MDSKWKEERAGFIAGEIGGAVIDLILAGMVINRNNIMELLDAKRRIVGNAVHKGFLRDAAIAVRKGM
ncbi:hypothetical protein [Yersinia thracica]|nr:hypothetical protein [Yersinia thracica]